jgi:hypothetical protein
VQRSYWLPTGWLAGRLAVAGWLVAGMGWLLAEPKQHDQPYKHSAHPSHGRKTEGSALKGEINFYMWS